IERRVPARLPGRAYSQPVLEHERLVELAPALRPIVGYLGGRDLDQRPSGGRLQGGQRRQLAGRSIDREFDDIIAAVDLLDSGRRQLEQFGEHQLRARSLYTNGEAAQPPNARFSFPNTPSS